MRRLRVALVLLALALALPVVLLVLRARDGERLERELRHQAIAARAFDEMERRLTALLDTEEGRSFEAYWRLVDPAVSLPPDLPSFVVGHFQIDPVGRLQARDPRALAPVVERALRSEPRGGRYRPKASADRVPVPVAEPQEQLPVASTQGDAYDLLSRLNVGQAQRAERKQKVRQELRSKLYADDLDLLGESSAGSIRLEGVDGPSGVDVDELAAAELRRARVKRQRDAATPSDRSRLRALGYAAEEVRESEKSASSGKEEEVAAAAAAEELALDRVRVTLDPMVGRPAGPGHLLLLRTALVGETGFRQGVVLSRPALSAWLESEVLEPEGLGRVARLRFDRDGAPDGWAEPGHLVFGHRFAEPFDALSAQIALAPLPTRGGSSALPIYALAALLLVVGSAGLLAVHRMARVVVSFAERRARFVASVSHELKTPLTAIRMYAEMLRDGLVGSEAKREEYYATITDESERLSRLIDNVLEFSRLEKGRREMALAAGGVAEVLEEAAAKLRPHAERQGFTLRVAAARDLPAVRFDRDVMLQVLFNLVDNAMKYAQPATASEVVLEARLEGERVVVGVRDWGPGVEGRHLRRIFEPFYRGQEELTRSAKGSGIGLALVKELGHAMGAAVDGANVEGGGFRVTLAFQPAAG